MDTVQTTGLAQPREGVARGIGARYSQTNYNLGFSHDFSNNNDRDNGYGVAIPDDKTQGELSGEIFTLGGIDLT